MSALAVSLSASDTTPAAVTVAPSASRPVVWAPSARPTGRLATQIALGALAAIALVALVARLLVARQVRDWLGFPFTGVPATPPEAGRIFAHNACAMLGICGLLLIAQLAARRPEGPARTQRCLQVAGEVLLAGVLAANLAVVGAALGAYGTRMVHAVVPHGPVELAAFALAIALYLQGRHRAIAVRHLIATGAASLGLLAAAAVLEALVVV